MAGSALSLLLLSSLCVVGKSEMAVRDSRVPARRLQHAVCVCIIFFILFEYRRVCSFGTLEDTITIAISVYRRGGAGAERMNDFCLKYTTIDNIDA